MNNRRFGAETTTDEVLAGIDLTGRTALVTGGASGLGLETARAFAAHGARVVIAARDLAKAEAAAAGIRKQHPDADVTCDQLDLASLASVREFAARFAAAHPTLDLLINNAGVMACPQGVTADGFEMQFGTNHLGHFLLTNLLAPTLIATARDGRKVRVVNLSSRAHVRNEVDFSDPHYRAREYEKWEAYGQSKTANVQFTVALDRRLAPHGVRVFAVHPGVIGTPLMRHLNRDDLVMLSKTAADRGATLAMKSVPQGAATSVYAATAPELAGKGGIYLEDCGIAPNDDVSMDFGVRSYAIDPAKAEALWDLSEREVGQNFPF